MNRIQLTVLFTVLVFLVSCGGGGGESEPSKEPPVSPPTKPIFDFDTTIEVDEDKPVSILLAAADAEEDDVLTYSISGEDAASFSIDAQSGMLDFIQVPDFDNPHDSDQDNVYKIIVKVVDKNGLSDEKAIEIRVQRVSEISLIIPPSLDIVENTRVIFDLSEASEAIEDIEIGLSGDDADFIDYDASTYLLSFIQAPDYEVPTDRDLDNRYAITIEATGPQGDKHTIDIHVVVKDQDESQNQAPVIFVGGRLSINENVEHALVSPLIISDLNEDEVTIELKGDDAAYFTVKDNGEIVSTQAFDFETPLDKDKNNQYEVVLEARDSRGAFNSANLSIAVNDIDEGDTVNQAPEIRIQKNINYFENSVNDVAVFVVEDPEGQTLTLYLTGVDAEVFILDEANKRIRFKTSPDFEAPIDSNSNNSYQITLNVSDGINVSQAKLNIVVLDKHESLVLSIDSPYITSSFEDSVNLRVPENIADIGILKIDNQVVDATYTITDLSADDVIVAGDTGMLSYLDAPNYEVSLGLYLVDITARLGEEESQTLQLAISTTNVEEPPYFDIEDDTIETLENHLEVQTFRIYPDRAGRSIAEIELEGEDSHLFKFEKDVFANGVNEVTLLFKDPPNFENPSDGNGDNDYLLSFKAKDSEGQSATQEFRVSVKNVPETNNLPELSVPELVYVSPYQKTIPLIAAAFDRDNDILTFSLEGEKSAYLEIDEKTGNINFSDTFDYDDLPLQDLFGFNFTVKVSDATDGSYDTAEVKLEYLTSRLDVLFPGKYSKLTETLPSQTSLVADAIPKNVNSVTLDDTPITQEPSGAYRLNELEYDLIPNVFTLESLQTGEDERRSPAIMNYESSIYSIAGLEYVNGRIRVSDKFANQILSFNSYSRIWQAFACQYTGAGEFGKFTKGESEAHFFVAVSDVDDEGNDGVVSLTSEAEDCYRFVAMEETFSDIEDILYDSARGRIYLFDGENQALYSINIENGASSKILDLAASIENRDSSRSAYLALDDDQLYLADAQLGKVFRWDLTKNEHSELSINQDQAYISGFDIDHTNNTAYVTYAPESISFDDNRQYKGARALDLDTFSLVEENTDRFDRYNFSYQIRHYAFKGGDEPRLVSIDSSTNNIYETSLDEKKYYPIVYSSFFTRDKMENIAIDEASNAVYLTVKNLVTASRIIKFMPGHGLGYNVFQDYSQKIKSLNFDKQSGKLVFLNNHANTSSHHPSKYNNLEESDDITRAFARSLRPAEDNNLYILLNDYEDNLVKLTKQVGNDITPLATIGPRSFLFSIVSFLVDEEGKYAYLLEDDSGIKIYKVDLSTGEMNIWLEPEGLLPIKIEWGANEDSIVMLHADGKRQALLDEISLSDKSIRSIVSTTEGFGPDIAYARDFAVHMRANVAYIISNNHLYAVDMKTGNRSILKNVSKDNQPE